MQEHFRVGCCSQIYTLVLALDHMFSKNRLDVSSSWQNRYWRTGNQKDPQTHGILCLYSLLSTSPSCPKAGNAQAQDMRNEAWIYTHEYLYACPSFPSHAHVASSTSSGESLLAKEHTYLGCAQTAYISWICALKRQKRLTQGQEVRVTFRRGGATEILKLSSVQGALTPFSFM